MNTNVLKMETNYIYLVSVHVFANISFTFSDLWQTDCMHSVLNPDSTWLWCKVVFPCDCELYWYGVHQICAVMLRASQHIYNGLCKKCRGIQITPVIPKLVQTIMSFFFPPLTFLTSSTPQLQPLCVRGFRELFWNMAQLVVTALHCQNSQEESV